MLQVLIVEDEKPISNLIRLSLTKEGYHCACAFDGATAADLLVDHHYDLILLDVMLPEIDGFELMEYIRPMKVPVIFLTANDLEEIGGLKIDTASMQVWRDEAEISLTKTEYELLLLFARNPRRALYRETIYERVWGEPYPFGSKAVDIHIQRLRKKTGWETCLRSVNKIGYRLEVDP